jgi:peptidoglycan/LPS O-acetylase OafA/YrhL
VEAAVDRWADRATTASASRMQWMDALRGVAASAVVVQHYCWPLVPREITRYIDPGIIGVVAFFCISGLVIPQSVMGRIRPSAKEFVLLRAFRLYPAYWVSLVIGALAVTGLRPTAVLINMSMLQRFVGVPDVIGVYWTLQVELIFYVVIALLIATAKVNRPAAAAWLTAMALAAAAALSLVRFVLHVKAPVAPAFGLSVILSSLLYYHHRKNGFLSNRAFALLVAAIYLFLAACFFAAYSTDWGYDENPWRFVLCYALGIGLFIAFQAANIRSQFLVWVGQISYPIYLLHKPIGEIVSHLWVKPPGALQWVPAVVALCILVLLASLVHYFVELPCVRLGRRLIGVG